MAYDSTQDTREHIKSVKRRMMQMLMAIDDRADAHDASKLEPPEKEAYDRVTPKLRGLTYGSVEYKEAVYELGDALQHHYANNSHHPEHYPDSIAGMSLLDLMEMFCDWKAASERHADGDFARSIEICVQRFGISDQLARILDNTRRELGW
jgi:hypothetical protein